MKQLLLILGIFSFVFVGAQSQKKNYRNIMKSYNIYELDAFLRDAAPNDQRRAVLKPRLMQLLEEYIQNAFPFDQRVSQMQDMLATLKKHPSTKMTFQEFSAKIRERQVAKIKEDLINSSNMTEDDAKNIYKQYQHGNSGSAAAMAAGTANYVNPEEAEFNKLISISPAEQKKKSVNLLNSLFDNDPSSKEAVVMIENTSDCNIIVRMEGAGGKKYSLPVPTKKENSIVVEKGSYLFTSLVCGAQYASQKKIDKALMLSLGNPEPVK